MSVKKLAAAPRKSTSPKQRTASAKKAGDEIVTLDRRRKSSEEADGEEADAPVVERRKKVQRRRQIDPTTCERDYSVEEVAFMNAMDEYKRTSGRMFPTCSEVLEVIRSLGYVQLSPAGRAMLAEIESPQMESAEAELQLADAR
jgi:hypothetical protein